MEITESTIYWITRLDSIKTLMETIGIAGFIGIGLVVPFISAIVADTYDSPTGSVIKAIKKSTKQWFPLWIFVILVGISSIFVPTTKEMCAIKIIPVIVNDDSVKEIPSDIAELAHEWLNELKPKKD